MNSNETSTPWGVQVHYRKIKVRGIEIFYREAGPADGPVVLLLHGFPTSSQMFRDLIPRLADKYRVLAPDYPGFGYSEMPDRTKFDYTFANYADLIDEFTREVGAQQFVLYVMDYGAPVGFRLAMKDPSRVLGFLVQNGNAYEAGFGSPFWDDIMVYWKSGAHRDREAIRWLTTLKATSWQYSNGVRDMSLVSPDACTLDQALLDRPGNAEIQLDLFYDYRTNVPLYPAWQAYFREKKPPTLVVWGKNDDIFVAPGAAPYQADIPDAEVHMLDTGHFALEECGPQIAGLIRDFLHRRLKRVGS